MSTPFRSIISPAKNIGTELPVMHSMSSETFSSIRPPTAANAFIANSKASAVVNDRRRAAGKAAAEEARRRADVAAAEEARRAVAAEEVRRTAVAAEEVRRIVEKMKYDEIVRIADEIYYIIALSRKTAIRTLRAVILELAKAASTVPALVSINWDKYIRDLSEKLESAEKYVLLYDQSNSTIEGYKAKIYYKSSSDPIIQNLLSVEIKNKLQLQQIISGIENEVYLIILGIFTEILNNAPPGGSPSEIILSNKKKLLEKKLEEKGMLTELVLEGGGNRSRKVRTRRGKRGGRGPRRRV